MKWYGWLLIGLPLAAGWMLFILGLCRLASREPLPPDPEDKDAA